MSHVACCEVVVRDLDVLRTAAGRLGLIFVEGQRTHRWYGRFLDDWRDPRSAKSKGRDPKAFGTCDHAIRLDPANPGDYEIGVVARPEGDGWDLVYDSYGPGRKLEQVAGVDLVRLRREVAAEVATRTLTRAGYRLSRQQEGERIRLVARA